VAIAAGLGAGVAVTDAQLDDQRAHTRAYLDGGSAVTASAGHGGVTSPSTADASAKLEGGAGSIGVSVASASGTVLVSADTQAYVGPDRRSPQERCVCRRWIWIHGHETARLATASMSAGSVGFIGVTVAGASADITGT
jgi:hypothetical protein